MKTQPTLLDLLLENGVAKSIKHEPFKILSKIYEQNQVLRLAFTVDVIDEAIFLILEVVVAKNDERGNELIRLPFGCFTVLPVAVRLAECLNRIFWKIQ
jgi:hypothetical protein